MNNCFGLFEISNCKELSSHYFFNMANMAELKKEVGFQTCK